MQESTHTPNKKQLGMWGSYVLSATSERCDKINWHLILETACKPKNKKILPEGPKQPYSLI